MLLFVYTVTKVTKLTFLQILYRLNSLVKQFCLRGQVRNLHILGLCALQQIHRYTNPSAVRKNISAK